MAAAEAKRESPLMIPPPKPLDGDSKHTQAFADAIAMFLKAQTDLIKACDDIIDPYRAVRDDPNAYFLPSSGANFSVLAHSASKVADILKNIFIDPSLAIEAAGAIVVMAEPDRPKSLCQINKVAAKWILAQGPAFRKQEAQDEAELIAKHSALHGKA